MKIKYILILLLSIGMISFSLAQKKKSTTKKGVKKEVVAKKEATKEGSIKDALGENEIHWVTVDEAQKLLKEKPKKIFIDFNTAWCGPCKLLDQNTFKNKDVVKYVNENYYAIKFNAEGKDSLTFKGVVYKNPNYKEGAVRNYPHEFSQAMGIKAYPTIMFLDEDLNALIPLQGYQSPNQFEIYLKLFGSNAHKSITTKEQWEEYQKNFKYEFKE